MSTTFTPSRRARAIAWFHLLAALQSSTLLVFFVFSHWSPPASFPAIRPSDTTWIASSLFLSIAAIIQLFLAVSHRAWYGRSDAASFEDTTPFYRYPIVFLVIAMILSSIFDSWILRVLGALSSFQTIQAVLYSPYLFTRSEFDH